MTQEPPVRARSVVLVAPAVGGEHERLAGHLERQRSSLQAALVRRHVERPVFAAIEPEVPAAIEAAAEAGMPVFVVPMAPQPSRAVDRLCRAAEAAAARRNASVLFAGPWHTQTRLLSALTSATYEALDAVWSLGSSDRAGYDWALGSKMATPVVFVAPDWAATGDATGDASDDERYLAALTETARLIAERLDLHAWSLACLPASPGAPASELEEQLRAVADRRETDAVIAPIGSLADDEWLLQAVDVEGMRIADALSLHIDRARSLNDDPVLIAALADLVVETAR